MEKQQNNFKLYISGLKGMACIFILIGHFLEIYKHAKGFPSIPVLDAVYDSPFSFVLEPGFWLYLFFVISGYLVAKSRIDTAKSVILKSVNRFFRFAFPIFFAYVIIFLIYRFIGFHNAETAALFQRKWFQEFYLSDFSVKDVLLGPVDVLILGKSDFNSPYWVLRDMFISSIAVYIMKYFYQKMSEKKHDSICFTVLVVITFLSGVASPVFTACFIGMLISFYEESEFKKSPCFAFWLIVLAISLYVLPEHILSSVIFGVIIILVPKVKLINDIFSSALFSFLGKISWGIYSFHWPLMCSIGALMLINPIKEMGLKAAFGVSFLVVIISTLIISAVYYYTFEKLSSYLTQKINQVLVKALH